MGAVHRITAPSGFAGLWDAGGSAELAASARAGTDAGRSRLREAARAGDLFLLETEDPATLSIEVLVGDDLASTLRTRFAEGAGAFRLRAPSGELVLGPLPPDAAGEKVSVDPGEYVLTPYVPEHDPVRYREEMVGLVGEEDWAFHERATKIGALGCFSILFGALLVALPPTRPLWGWWILIFSLPTLTYAVLERTPRMRRVEAAIRAGSSDRPELVLLLRRDDELAGRLQGGWFTPPGF